MIPKVGFSGYILNLKKSEETPNENVNGMPIQELRMKSYNRSRTPMDFNKILPSNFIYDTKEKKLYLTLERNSKTEELNCLPISINNDLLKIKKSDTEKEPNRFIIKGRMDAVV